MEDLFLAGKYIHVICYLEIVVVKGIWDAKNAYTDGSVIR
jgi:hypothetical protein